MAGYDYIHDGKAIYERSFAIIRAEADLSRFSGAEADVAVRMIHACGDGRGGAAFRFLARFRRTRRAPPLRPARRSSATPRWWRTA